ncbi:MAG: hypothetical protein ABJG88_05270 [Litorimonas sp.]
MPLKDHVPKYAKDDPWGVSEQIYYDKLYQAYPYPWVKEMTQEQFHKTSKMKLGHFKKSPAPLSLVYKILDFILSRPEMVTCYKALGARVEDDDPWPEEEAAPLPYFTEYLKHKYGNEHLGTRCAKGAALSIGAGSFSGVNDPAILDYLLLYDNQVFDDGYRHGG